MPSLNLTGFDNGFSWQITDLSSPFNSSSYESAGITKYQFTKEATSISGIVSSIDATSSRTQYSTPEIDVEYSSGTYTFWAWCKALNGTYYPAGSATVIVTNSLSGVRPDDWEWTSKIEQDAPIAITAIEWNNFTSRINAFRIYKGLSNYSFTTAYGGETKISASIVNEARIAINAIDGSGEVPDKVEPGDTIYASFFIGLADALNNIS